MSASDVFAIGNNFSNVGVILHYDGSSWSAMTVLAGTMSGAQSGVWGSSATDVFVVADGIWHYDGSAWSTMPLPSGTMWQLYGVWGSSATDVFAVGESGTILHYGF
jgi:hypothetical protein